MPNIKLCYSFEQVIRQIFVSKSCKKHDQQKGMHLQYATVNMYFHQKWKKKNFCVEDFLVASMYYFKKNEVLKWGGGIAPSFKLNQQMTRARSAMAVAWQNLVNIRVIVRLGLSRLSAGAPDPFSHRI
jgi:hypothetical protein